MRVTIVANGMKYDAEGLSELVINESSLILHLFSSKFTSFFEYLQNITTRGQPIHLITKSIFRTISFWKSYVFTWKFGKSSSNSATGRQSWSHSLLNWIKQYYAVLISKEYNIYY